MDRVKMEDVFKISGVPTVTFVQPKEFTKLLVNLRTPGRGLVVEGPSGIGKTTAVETAIQELQLTQKITKLKALRADDLEIIRELPKMKAPGVVLIDDFHRLPDEIKASIADYLKLLADEESKDAKLIIVGINRAGEGLVEHVPDLVNRIDIISFERNSSEKVRELIRKGEERLNIEINVADEIVESANGSFYVAQLLSHEVCLAAAMLEEAASKTQTSISFELVRSAVWDRLKLRFYGPCKLFCQGTKMRPEGRAPYLHILHWLAECSDWSLDLRDAMRAHSELRGSVGQVVDKSFLRDLINSSPEVRKILYYTQNPPTLTVEDPQFVFFLRYIPWAKFAKEIGFLSVDFKKRYDFALSFAGADRQVAEALFARLSESELEVFYDKNEQHRILAEDVEDYLRPIYESEASKVVCLLSPDYPKRIWTKFESDAFRARFADGDVVPVWYANANAGWHDESRKVGGFDFDPAQAIEPQVDALVKLLVQKIGDSRFPPA